jgi:hypothetical protein
VASVASLDVTIQPRGSIIRRGGLTMKKQSATLALAFLSVITGTFQQETAGGQPTTKARFPEQNASQAAWREFSPRLAGFSVLMPGTPKEETETKEFPVVGKGMVHLFVLANEYGVYVVGYLEVPGLAQQSQSFCDSFGKGFLAGIGEGTAKGAGGKVVKDSDISMGSYPGKEILIQVPAGLATARAFFIKRRGYQLIAVPPSGSDDAGNVKKFLDSFKVTAGS